MGHKHREDEIETAAGWTLDQRLHVMQLLLNKLERGLPPAPVAAQAEQTVPTFSVTPTCKCVELGRVSFPVIMYRGLITPEVRCSNCGALWAYVLVHAPAAKGTGSR